MSPGELLSQQAISGHLVRAQGPQDNGPRGSRQGAALAEQNQPIPHISMGLANPSHRHTSLETLFLYGKNQQENSNLQRGGGVRPGVAAVREARLVSPACLGQPHGPAASTHLLAPNQPLPPQSPCLSPALLPF